MKTIDGKMFRAMVETGANLLHNNHPEIDALNVFPVPDGDTGTNMSLTFTNGAAEVKKLESDNLGDVAKTLSKGLLMGARGNSGVILSQIFRGVAKSLKGKESADAVELAEAFASGAKVAYKAVMRPVEGTILTVIREASEAGSAYVKEDMEVEDWFSYFVKEANDALDRTPELLPVLKEVGVVDSGGAGLVVVLTGFMLALAGEEVEAYKQAVVQGREIDAGSEPVGGFPLQAGVADVLHHLTCGAVEEAVGDEVGARRLTVDVIVTHMVEAHVQLQVVDTLHVGHPRLVGEHP